MSTDLIPAIDLRNGQCVRLHQGDFAQETQYDANPVELATAYADEGATRLHVVDLDGARSGQSEQAALIGEMQRASGLPVQTGGGLREEAQIKALLGAGAARVVVGTTVVKQPDAFGGWLKTYGADRVVAALDVRAGDDGEFYPATAGWTEAGDQTLDALLDTLAGYGLEHLLCTDISRDGTLAGPNLKLYEALVSRGLKVQASGGVSGLNDLTALKAIGVDGIIVGKALLEGRFTVAEALQCLQDA
ncbi:MAG: 1-(5-phosphoribosyl)-5-[(5-phosphoribosylamino)methylideneamino]imidazole-4-carboxamide isomerase [Pseudomonadota bacterium]